MSFPMENAAEVQVAEAPRAAFFSYRGKSIDAQRYNTIAMCTSLSSLVAISVVMGSSTYVLIRPLSQDRRALPIRVRKAAKRAQVRGASRDP